MHDPTLTPHRKQSLLSRIFDNGSGRIRFFMPVPIPLTFTYKPVPDTDDKPLGVLIPMPMIVLRCPGWPLAALGRSYIVLDRERLYRFKESLCLYDLQSGLSLLEMQTTPRCSPCLYGRMQDAKKDLHDRLKICLTHDLSRFERQETPGMRVIAVTKDYTLRNSYQL